LPRGRASRPDLDRPFRVPLSPWLPALSALICVYLMANLSARPGCGSGLDGPGLRRHRLRTAAQPGPPGGEGGGL